jgi:2-polyprenyl-3-methyl-5-hydroxy-6-metoxy-1,4-benzoquinol methylase
MKSFRETELVFNLQNRTLRFICPANPDEVLDSITEEQYEKDRFLPYWAELWPSSKVFFEFLKKQSFPPGTLVCELGCGLGVISALLADKGCTVISVDIASDGCGYTHANLERNGFVPRVICGDWRNIALKNQFDIVVASDVLYESRWIHPVLSCISSLLKKTGKAWIADPCRRHWEEFKTAANSSGFKSGICESHFADNKLIKVEIIELVKTQ